MTKKNKIILSSILLAIVAFIVIFAWHRNYQKNNFLENSNFIMSIRSDELSEKLDNAESFFIYVGRPTCSDCRRVYPQLAKSVDDSQTYMYYYNTDRERPHELFEYLIDFMGIEAVPSIIYIDKGRVISKVVEDEIKNKKFIDDFIENQ
jgi:hypothetical protein